MDTSTKAAVGQRNGSPIREPGALGKFHKTGKPFPTDNPKDSPAKERAERRRGIKT